MSHAEIFVGWVLYSRTCIEIECGVPGNLESRRHDAITVLLEKRPQTLFGKVTGHLQTAKCCTYTDRKEWPCTSSHHINRFRQRKKVISRSSRLRNHIGVHWITVQNFSSVRHHRFRQCTLLPTVNAVVRAPDFNEGFLGDTA